LRYHGRVIDISARRRSFVFALVATAFAVAAPARAASVPTGTVIRVDRTVDVAAFSRILEARFRLVLHRVIAADIDRDGDLDILAATDRGFVVWLNDGAGRLTSQSAKHKPAVDGRSPGDTWREDDARDGETVQDDVPSPRVASEYAHAPPLSVRQLAPCSQFTLHSDPAYGTRVPRAPPSVL
jgi:hypothetical protein